MLEINDRALKILQGIVERYIQEGQPVGSSTLTRNGQIPFSSATVRNIMSELENAGYLHSPHTSSGRVPTTRAYRLFVDHLLMVQHPAIQGIEALRDQLRDNSDAKAMLTQASAVLSDLTGLVALVTLPNSEQMVLRQVEFLPLAERQVLVILVMDNHQVQNRIVSVDKRYTRQELYRLGQYLTEHYAGCELAMIRPQLARALESDQSHLDHLINIVTELVTDIDREQIDQAYCLSGQSRLFDLLGEENYQQLRQLYEAIAEKRDILSVFDRVVDAKGLQIFIGEESGHKVLDACSVVTAPYSVGGQCVGVLGVIGPTRMPYSRVISAVDVTAKLLSEAFCE